MRQALHPSQIARLVGPLARALDTAWSRMHWWVSLMILLYLGSGITVIKPDEVAVILRWGQLVGSTRGLQEHGPGLLFAFPRPVDEVVRVQVKKVQELRIGELMNDRTGPGALDPVTEGYALTGDQNIVIAEMVARYRVRDPAEWALYGPKPEDILRVEATAALVRSLGEVGVDKVLSLGRKDLIATATLRTQQGLDAAHCGCELTSLELTSLAPPRALAKDFDAVQTAVIRAETVRKEAQAFAQTAVPEAEAKADGEVQSARAAAVTDLAQAEGETDAFLALEKEYRANPGVVRERLYRDAVDKALGTAEVRWIPPPSGGRYRGLRIQLSPPFANPNPEAAPAEAETQ